MNAVSGCLAAADADTVRREFAPRLIRWQRRHGRHGLPWQGADAYGVWLSEIMLQQTQVATVLDYYPRFRSAFPDVASLAAAPEDEVLRLWAGLGYYSRARNLHKAAAQVSRDFGGRFPAERSELEKLAGVGRSTAAAIAAFAFGRRETILDGNVKRVLCRLLALDGDPADKTFERQLWRHAEQLLPPAATAAPPSCRAKKAPPPSNSKPCTGSTCAAPTAACCWQNARPKASGQDSTACPALIAWLPPTPLPNNAAAPPPPCTKRAP